jgi:DNA-binding NarL/FixJ family response regulator
MIKVGLIIRHPLTANALERALATSRSPDIQVVYRQSSPEGCPAHIPALDVVCIHTERLNAIHPRWLSAAPTIALIPTVCRRELLAYLRAGGRGCLVDDILLADLVDAIVTVQQGNYCLCPQVRRALLTQPQLKLTPRQQEIARAISELRARSARVTVQALADHLAISPKTVYAHLYQLAAALGIAASVETIIDHVAQLNL